MTKEMIAEVYPLLLKLKSLWEDITETAEAAKMEEDQKQAA